MARGRDRMGRFTKSRRGVSSLGRIRRRAASIGGTIRARVRGAFNGLPSWAKPSTITAGTGVAVGLGKLILKPLPNGDSWQRRAILAWQANKAGNAEGVTAALVDDGNGHGIADIAVLQLEQNALGSVATIAGFGIVAAFLKWAGM